MNVAELIARLQTLPQDAVVLHPGYEMGMDAVGMAVTVRAVRCSGDPETDDHPEFFGRYYRDDAEKQVCPGCGAPLVAVPAAVYIGEDSDSP